MSPTQSLAFVKQNHDRYLREYQEFLRIPSVSTLSAHKPDMQRCADWVAGQLRGLGFDGVAILPTAGHPVVYAE